MVVVDGLLRSGRGNGATVEVFLSCFVFLFFVFCFCFCFFCFCFFFFFEFGYSRVFKTRLQLKPDHSLRIPYHDSKNYIPKISYANENTIIKILFH